MWMEFELGLIGFWPKLLCTAHSSEKIMIFFPVSYVRICWSVGRNSLLLLSCMVGAFELKLSFLVLNG